MSEINTANAVREAIEADLLEIKTRLEVSVLDGTPFLLCINHEDGLRVYGEWHSPMGNVRGFQSAELVPPHLCGTIQMSEKSAQENVARMNASGTYPAHYMHWRKFLQARRASLEETLKCLPVDGRKN